VTVSPGELAARLDNKSLQTKVRLGAGGGLLRQSHVSHNQLVAMIPEAQHILVSGADHLSILKVDAVVEQILEMVMAVTGKPNNPARVD